MAQSVYGTWFCLPFLPLAIIFFVSVLAETNRTPFDLPEAEAELVAGFNVEYSSTPFALFFLAEYSNILLMSSFTTILFLGGWDCIVAGTLISPFSSVCFISKVLLMAFLFVLVRGELPRYRYDQLMNIC